MSASSLDDLTRRLGEIQAELAALAPEASPERYALLTERDGLRRAAAAFRRGRDDARPTKELESELAALQRRRNESVARRTGFATSKGGSNHGPSPGAWVKLGSQALAGDDLSRVNARISEIQDVLVRRLGSKS